MLNKVYTAIISLLIAIGLWMYVVTVVSPGSENTYTGIEVVKQSEGILEERGLVITDEHNPAVNLRLSGNRSDLNKLNVGNILVTVDVSKITEPGVHQLRYDVIFPGDVANNAITVENRDPDYVTITVQNKITKPVPVTVSFTGKVEEGYLVDKEAVELDHREILVTGAQDEINRIAMARVEVDVTDMIEDTTRSYEYVLCDDKGAVLTDLKITAEQKQVNVTVPVLMKKEIPLMLTVNPGGGATEETSLITQEPKVITVSGKAADLENLNEINLGTVELGTIYEDTQMKFPVVLPEGVNNLTGTAEAVVDIQFPDLRTKVLTVSEIEAVKVPKGMEAEIITKGLELRFRGPKAKIDELTAEMITVTVDFSKGTEGTATMTVTITLAEGYTEIGVLGSYSVSATLRASATATAEE